MEDHFHLRQASGIYNCVVYFSVKQKNQNTYSELFFRIFGATTIVIRNKNSA